MDIVKTLQQKASISDDDIKHVRIAAAHGAKMHRPISTKDSVYEMEGATSLYVDIIPPEQRDDAMGETDRLIYCFHFDKDPRQAHNIPFVFVVVEGEIFSETKERLSKRTGIKGKAFEKVKFAVVRDGLVDRPIYLDDGDILYEKLGKYDELGLDHVNKTRNTWAPERLNIR